MNELTSFGGTAEGCPVCLDEHSDPLPFASDSAALAHISKHSSAELAFALLTYKAILQHILTAVDEPGGIPTEHHLEELMGDVEDTAWQSPARPRQA
ncbi:hypothetical protein ACWGLE_05245 [Streptomyces sp. NPDC055897]